MRKTKNWIGMLALALLMAQSTIGIINYTQTSAQPNFPRMDRINGNEDGRFAGNPPQMNSQNTEDADHSDSNNEETSNSASNDETAKRPENGQMPHFNEQPMNQPGSFAAALRNFANGIPGLIMNIFSLGLALIWLILSILLRRKYQSVN
ncbi:hypothetical protein MUB24_12180 [Lederbergia sp. NSJ-179]|uniref:hypothetical protein n=1 Tax=Lederbergia sp. NSJ-179 TaxID=2931402 RepID=UPI001FD44F12|nr:hypothetical protein [Lederbergia sp. NSJ-179]MCJ7841639.1 hypothetical protein [Lederbergia sp. NSJ-179]